MSTTAPNSPSRFQPSRSSRPVRSAPASLSPSSSAPAIGTDLNINIIPSVALSTLSTSTSQQDLFSIASLSSPHPSVTETTLLQQQPPAATGIVSQLPPPHNMLSLMSAFGQRLLGRGNRCKRRPSSSPSAGVMETTENEHAPLFVNDNDEYKYMDKDENENGDYKDKKEKNHYHHMSKKQVLQPPRLTMLSPTSTSTSSSSPASTSPFIATPTPNSSPTKSATAAPTPSSTTTPKKTARKSSESSSSLSSPPSPPSPPSTSSSSWRRQRYIQFKRQQHQHKKNLKHLGRQCNKKSLKSPRAILRALVPSDATQTRRMGLLLLNESPKRDELIRCAWNGCSSTNRSHVWRLLMGYEPLKFSQRNATLLQKRKQYRQYVRMLYAPLGSVKCAPSACTAQVVANVDVSSCESGNNDDDDDDDDENNYLDTDIVVSRYHHQKSPCGGGNRRDLQEQEDYDNGESINGEKKCSNHSSINNNTTTSSTSATATTKTIEYSTFSAKTLRQIEMDLPRTHPHIPIFHVPEVRDPMRRILYIFGMLNPHKNYVQGMNEIVSAILVVFLIERILEMEVHEVDSDLGKETDPLLGNENAYQGEEGQSVKRHGGKRNINKNQKSNNDENPILSFLKRRDLSNGCLSATQLVDAEADAFWVYSELIARADDNFCGDQAGILRRVNQMDLLVSKVDPLLSLHLSHNGNDFLQFGFRWINCLLMRELPLHLVIKYWDALLAHPKGIADFHVYFCAALLTRFTETLITLDFEESMIFLQHLPTTTWTEHDIDELLSQANVWEQAFDINTV